MLVKGYAVCGLVRSGSTLLCDLLTSTKVLGCPREYFNVDAGRIFAGPGYPEGPHEQLEALKQLAATSNGVYGLKIFPRQFDQSVSTGWTQTLPGLSFVFLRRTDLLGQAISLVRAAQTGQWNSFNSARGEATYDGANIGQQLALLARQEAGWRTYFAESGVAPLHLIYEDLLADPQAAVDAVAQLVGLQERAIAPANFTELAIQRDALNDEWRSRFIAEARNLSAFHKL